MSSKNGIDHQSEYRRLPSVDALLQKPEITYLSAAHGEKLVTDAARTVVDEARAAIAEGAKAPAETLWPELIDAHLAQAVEPQLRPVINATGVIIHTNLGRAPLSESARDAVAMITHGFNNLEYDLDAGKRGSRYNHARELLTELTGAEDALVVNNCASAVFLALTALCQGREVIVSRGQLVEIGGGFRIPDVLRQSGATLVEVGTTNRTHPHDFATAINDETAALMRIHSSNFRLMGFVTMPELADLVEIAHSASAGHIAGASVEEKRPIVIDDLGSGTLIETGPYGLTPEPTVQASIAAGADVVAFSGDKLLGGPQAGILVGKAAYIAQLRSHPLARALRVDKMTLAALEATLRSYAAERATKEIPVWQMISATKAALTTVAESWRVQLEESGIACHLWDGDSAIGGGSLPGETLPTTLLAVSVDKAQLQPDEAAARLRSASRGADALPVVCRIQQDHLVFDPRTILPEQADGLLNAIRALFQS